jgi:hypothetical protein
VLFHACFLATQPIYTDDCDALVSQVIPFLVRV